MWKLGFKNDPVEKFSLEVFRLSHIYFKKKKKVKSYIWLVGLMWMIHNFVINILYRILQQQ